MVEVFRNKLIVSNIGGLVEWLPKEDFGRYSRPRNNLMTNLLSRTPLMEKIGSGINRMKDAMTENSLSFPSFEFNEYNFSTVLYDEEIKTTQETAQETTQETAQEVVSKSVKEQIVDLLNNNPNLTRRELVGILDKSDATIKEHIRNLQKEGRLERIGSTKGGHWEVI